MVKIRKPKNQVKLEGKYLINGSNLSSSNDRIKLVIGTRKNPSINKPKKYLLWKHSPSKFTYLSSMYPVDETTFSIDYEGVNYQVSFSGSEAIFTTNKERK